MLECPTCGREFDSRRGLTVHKNTGHGEKWHDRERLKTEYRENKRSATELSEGWGCDPSTIRNWLVRYGIDRWEAKDFHRVEYVDYSHHEQGYEVWKHHYGEDRGTTVFVHRLLAVSKYGFDSVTGKHVHHKINIPWLNTEDNIELVDPSEHIRHHQESGEVPVGSDAQRKGGFDPSGLFVGVPNEDRYEGMAEEMEGSL